MTHEDDEPPTLNLALRSPSEQQVLAEHPQLDRYLTSPVERFVKAPTYEGFKLAEPEPDAIDAITRPGVIEALRDILEDLTHPAEADALGDQE